MIGFKNGKKPVCFRRLWAKGLLAYTETQGVDWSFLSVDGAMSKVPLGVRETGRNPADRGNLVPI